MLRPLCQNQKYLICTLTAPFETGKAILGIWKAIRRPTGSTQDKQEGHWLARRKDAGFRRNPLLENRNRQQKASRFSRELFFKTLRVDNTLI
jgi:hypothetical protein